MEGRDIQKLKLYLGFSPGRLPTVKWIIYCCDVLLYETRRVKNIFLSISEKKNESLGESLHDTLSFIVPVDCSLISWISFWTWLFLCCYDSAVRAVGVRSFLCFPEFGLEMHTATEQGSLVGAGCRDLIIIRDAQRCNKQMAKVLCLSVLLASDFPGLYGQRINFKSSPLSPCSPHTISGKQADQILKNQSFHIHWIFPNTFWTFWAIKSCWVVFTGSAYSKLSVLLLRQSLLNLTWKVLEIFFLKHAFLSTHTALWCTALWCHHCSVHYCWNVFPSMIKGYVFAVSEMLSRIFKCLLIAKLWNLL